LVAVYCRRPQKRANFFGGQALTGSQINSRRYRRCIVSLYRPRDFALAGAATVFFSAITVTVLVLAFSGLRVAQEYQRGVVFRLGRFTGLRGPGLYWIIPLGIERVVTIDTRTRTVSAEQQETITRDSVTVKVNAVLWYRIVDAGKSVIAVTDAPAAVYQLALTSLRNIIGQHDLDEVLQERNKINAMQPRLFARNVRGSSRPMRSWRRP
jgi:regulator of protease activity HflC (stomatin/prohibitin superfamily)